LIALPLPFWSNKAAERSTPPADFARGYFRTLGNASCGQANRFGRRCNETPALSLMSALQVNSGTMLRTERRAGRDVRISCPNIMMVEMSDDVVGELLSALFKLGALQLRLGIIATEAMLAFGSRANQPIGALNKAMPSAISEEEIETAALAIEVRLIASHELGFQCLLRANFSGEAIRDMARAALEAARDIE